MEHSSIWQKIRKECRCICQINHQSAFDRSMIFSPSFSKGTKCTQDNNKSCENLFGSTEGCGLYHEEERRGSSSSVDFEFDVDHFTYIYRKRNVNLGSSLCPVLAYQLVWRHSPTKPSGLMKTCCPSLYCFTAKGPTEVSVSHLHLEANRKQHRGRAPMILQHSPPSLNRLKNCLPLLSHV